MTLVHHNAATRNAAMHNAIFQGDSGTEPEPGTGTVGTVFPETESGTGTAGTVFQEPKPEPEPFFPVKLYRNTDKPFLQRNRRNRKPEPLEPFHPQTVTEPNRTGASLIFSHRNSYPLFDSVIAVMPFPVFQHRP